MYDYSSTNGTIYGLSRILIRDVYSPYYGKDGVYTMNKDKLVKTGLKLGALALAGVVTILNNKTSSDEMKETVAKEVAKAMSNQAKES